MMTSAIRRLIDFTVRTASAVATEIAVPAGAVPVGGGVGKVDETMQPSAMLWVRP